MDDVNDFDSIPGMPADDHIRADLLRTAGPEYWRPNGIPDGTPTDFAGVSEEAMNKVLGARILQGPGPHGTPYQWALWEQHQRSIELEKEEARLMDRLTSIKGYDRDTGEGISAITEDQAVALSHQLTLVQQEKARLIGKAGEERLKRKLDDSVRRVKERIRREHITAEAKRRAAAAVTEDEINRLAGAFRKTIPNG
jgi:hypothetical protein